VATPPDGDWDDDHEVAFESDSGQVILCGVTSGCGPRHVPDRACAPPVRPEGVLRRPGPHDRGGKQQRPSPGRFRVVRHAVLADPRVVIGRARRRSADDSVEEAVLIEDPSRVATDISCRRATEIRLSLNTTRARRRTATLISRKPQGRPGHFGSWASRPTLRVAAHDRGHPQP
jgi:hypothetical protein